MKRNLFDDIFDPSSDLNNHSDEYIKTTCLNCGFTENVPDFIYDECSRKKYHLKLKKRFSTLECPKCEKETAVPSSFLKN